MGCNRSLTWRGNGSTFIASDFIFTLKFLFGPEVKKFTGESELRLIDQSLPNGL